MFDKDNDRAGVWFVSKNQITLLENGETYFQIMAAALDRAKYEICLLSYIFQNNIIGRRIAEALKRAALRGVMVMKFRPKIYLWTLRRRRLRRLHRKIVIVDQTAAFGRGINIIDDFDTSC